MVTSHTHLGTFSILRVQLPLDSIHLPCPVFPPPPKLCQSHDVKVTLQPVPSEPAGCRRTEGTNEERKGGEREKKLTRQGQLQQGMEAIAASTKNSSPSIFLLH